MNNEQREQMEKIFKVYTLEELFSIGLNHALYEENVELRKYAESKLDDLVFMIGGKIKIYRDGEPCFHCRTSHISHPCEVCGRVSASGSAKIITIIKERESIYHG